MPTHDEAQARMNAREEFKSLVEEWVEAHPELVTHPEYFAEHVAQYAFDELLSE